MYDKEYDIMHRVFMLLGKEIHKKIADEFNCHQELINHIKYFTVPFDHPVTSQKHDITNRLISCVKLAISENPKKLLVDGVIRHHLHDAKTEEVYIAAIQHCVVEHTIMMYYKVTDTKDKTIVEYKG